MRLINRTEIFRIALPSADVEAFLSCCEGAEWYAFDTGERVMTDEGPDAEAVLLVDPMASRRAPSVRVAISQ